jgi:hypothetical protein
MAYPLVRHLESLKLLRIFAGALQSCHGHAPARRADLQEPRGVANAGGVADRSLSGCCDAAETSSDQQFYVVAGPGFEPG